MRATPTELERTIFAHLRKLTIDKGFNVDEALYPAKEDYITALEAVKADKGFVIALRGVGASFDKGAKADFTISIIRKNTRPGGLGQDNTKYFEFDKETETFTKKVRKGQSRDFPFEVRTIGNGTEGQRVMEEVIYEALGSNQYLAVADGETPNDFSEERSLFLTYNGDYDLSNGQISERIYLYTFPDVFVQVESVEREGIAKIVDAGFKIGAASDPASPTAEEVATAINISEKST